MSVPIVALGGSAGSLDALKEFFQGLPTGLDAAFVVIQHLSPDHESLLDELLQRVTPMPVKQALENTELQGGHVYVIPPNRYLTIRDGCLHAAEPTNNTAPRLTVDVFFRSLAADRQDCAIGVIFSGGGSDGTIGVRAVRGAGGMTMAQDPASAQHRDMPQHAISTGLVDYVLPPAQMGQTLLRYLENRQKQGRNAPPVEVSPTSQADPDIVETILTLVLARTGRDFRLYKKKSIRRRIERRMAIHQIDHIQAYLQFLTCNREEILELQKDFLISVTEFFRDNDAFDNLDRLAITPLVEQCQPDTPLRV